MIDKEIKDELTSKVDSNRFNEHLLLQMNINNAIYGALLKQQALITRLMVVVIIFMIITIPVVVATIGGWINEAR
jgi:hypothetical protein